MKEPNMALREIRDIRPHLVLEGLLEPKTFWRQEREREEIGFGNSWRFVSIFPCLFKILQEGRRKKAKASSSRGFEVRTKP